MIFWYLLEGIIQVTYPNSVSYSQTRESPNSDSHDQSLIVLFRQKEDLLVSK
jgi:hypothetical protein